MIALHFVHDINVVNKTGKLKTAQEKKHDRLFCFCLRGSHANY